MKLRSLIFALLLALSISGVVFAHADIARSDPTANAVLDVAPAQVTIEFTEPVEPRLSKIEVLYDDGSVADNNDTTRDPADSKVLRVSLQESREGTYIVSWRALSEVDGHVTSGSYVFSVGQPIDRTKASATTTSDPTAWQLESINRSIRLRSVHEGIVCSPTKVT